MDTSETTNASHVPESGVNQDHPVETANSPSSTANATEEATATIILTQNPEESTPQNHIPSVEQPRSTPDSAAAIQPNPRAPTPPPTANSGEEVEHAYWADIEEDRTTPDEEELKEIESAEADYSACDHSYWENNFFRDLEDPEYVPQEKARLTWKIKGIRGTPEAPNRNKIMRSPAAYIGGYWWRIKFYPRGNNVGSLSIYIECSETMPDPDDNLPDTDFTVRRACSNATLDDSVPDVEVQTPATNDSQAWMESYKAQYSTATPPVEATHGSSKTWRVPAQIGVIVYNPEEPRTGWMQSSCHQFNPHNLDWGWTYFHGPWDQIHTRRRGQHRALLNNDTLSFDAYIRVIDDPTRSLWWHPSDSEPTWDSLALTGYRPLGDSVINHSAEVAGLASWLHIAPFCNIIQKVDVLEHLTNCDIKPKPLCDALQKLLWHLRRRTKSLQYVDTDGITSILRNMREFSGDVSEFWERLRRTLELELAGTETGKEFAKLFDSPPPVALEGVNTLPKDYNSRIFVRADEFKSTGEAVKGYLGAKSGTWSLPPILHVELGRHTLDKAMRWQLMFNKVELDEELDLAPFVTDDSGSKYVLYGYVVHRGRRTSGKFFSILRPAGPGTKWLAFDDGSDNRVECLTQKTAKGPHLGIDPSQTVDHKKGHDVPVAVMYVRSDMVSDILPGPQGPWEVSEDLKNYYETGVYQPATVANEKSRRTDVQVEVYSMSDYDKLNSLFDTYDLMSHSKANENVIQMTMPRSSSIAELRKKIASEKSAGKESIGAERVRLWHIGHTRAQCGPTLAFDLISELNVPLDSSGGVMRFWMETISEEDAKFFAIPDPPCIAASEDKREESISERPVSEATERPGSVVDGDAVASSSAGVVQDPATSRTEDSTTSDGPPLASMSPENDAAQQENVESGTISSSPVQETTAENTTTGSPETSSSGQETLASPSQRESLPSDSTSNRAEQPEVKLPVGHTYFFIQMFDAEKQVLRTVGSFFSKLETNVKASIRKHMQWTIRRDFMMWKRVDGTTVTTISPAENFMEVVVPHGSCIIIGDKLRNDKRTELSVSGLFSSPDRLVQYLWAESRQHPVQGFTGTKTVEATFTSDYYSGDFLNGHYHGRGKHFSGTGTVYEGDFIFGRRHGQGKMEYPTGDIYDGDWVEDVRHGQGTYIEKKTGNKYVGGYKDGKRHGKGISYWEVADEEADLCQICYSEEQNAVFCDCGHVCSCVTCAKQVDLCPICRKTIKSVIKIYRT